MDRRDFLKSLGLGGLALTLPKPLEVVAARMTDLKGPPVHMGLARFRDLAGVMVYGFSVCVDPAFLDPGRYVDLINTWGVHLAAHENGENYIPVLKAPLRRLVDRYEDAPVIDPRFFKSKMPSRLLVPTMLDVWIVPYEKPKHALPPLTVTLHGEVMQKTENESWIQTFGRRDVSVQVRTVRLERTRAIELGLVSPSDPFEAV
jgi:hypothetical protein